MKRTKPYEAMDREDLRTMPSNGRLGPQITPVVPIVDDVQETQRLMDSFTEKEIYELAWLFTLGQVRATMRRRTLDRERRAETKGRYSDGSFRLSPEESKKKQQENPDDYRNWYQEMVTGKTLWRDIPEKHQRWLFERMHSSQYIPDDYPPKAKWLTTYEGKMTLDRLAKAEERKQKEIRAIKQEAIMEWTEELLQSSLALPDGTIITWGSATRNDHEARIEMLHVNVMANAEAIRRHEAAVIALVSSGKKTLNGLPS